MKSTNRFKLLSLVLVFAYLLSACSGAQGTPSGGKPESKEVAFTGTVESVGAGQITVSGQVVTLDAASVVDANIQVGDIVKVEAQVSSDGAVIALKVESFGADDSNTNSDDANANDSNANDDNANANTNDDNSNTGTDDANDNGAGGIEQEITGLVSAISASSVTVDGVQYQFGSFTEIKDPIFAGDTVKLHVTVGADGSLTVREIEKISGTDMDNDNSNGNSNDDDGNDDNGNDDNSNDDNSNDDDSNDDNGNDDDSNDDNSNDNDSNDDNSNSGSNSNGG